MGSSCSCMDPLEAEKELPERPFKSPTSYAVCPKLMSMIETNFEADGQDC